MATPLVSGAVALMLQKNSSLTPDQVKARLMKTAWKGFNQYTSSADNYGNTYSNQYDIFTYGAGCMDIDAALNNTDLASGVALSPTAVYNSSNGTVSLINTNSVVFRWHQRGLGCDFSGLGKFRGVGRKHDSRNIGSVGQHQRGLGCKLHVWLQRCLGCNFNNRQSRRQHSATATMETTRHRLKPYSETTMTNTLPIKAKVMIGMVAVASLCALSFGVVRWQSQAWPQLMLLLAAAALSSRFKVKLPGMSSSMSGKLARHSSRSHATGTVRQPARRNHGSSRAVL